jgi:hypothetical protein
MRKILWFVVLASVAIMPCPVRSQLMSGPMYGAGPRGYDWAIGTWSCINRMPSATGGTATQTLKVARAGGAIFFRSTSASFDAAWYDVYVPGKKMWVSPFILSDGTYGSESTTQSGRRVVWTGSAVFAGSGRPQNVRDTYVNSATKLTDLGEVMSAGVWKVQFNITCTKT